MRYKVLCIAILAGWLGLFNGQLALYEKGNTPAHIFPYRDQTYSRADRDLLEHGIPFHSREERSRLLEDYLS